MCVFPFTVASSRAPVARPAWVPRTSPGAKRALLVAGMGDAGYPYSTVLAVMILRKDSLMLSRDGILIPV